MRVRFSCSPHAESHLLVKVPSRKDPRSEATPLPLLLPSISVHALFTFIPIPSPSSHSLVGHRRASCDSHAYSLNCSNRPVCSTNLIAFDVPSLVVSAHLIL